MNQIVTHFTDNDLYTYTCQYYILHTYPRAEVRYSFFDRNHTRYPEGFGKLLQEQIDGMKDVVITEEEIEFMKKKKKGSIKLYIILPVLILGIVSIISNII